MDTKIVFFKIASPNPGTPVPGHTRYDLVFPNDVIGNVESLSIIAWRTTDDILAIKFPSSVMRTEWHVGQCGIKSGSGIGTYAGPTDNGAIYLPGPDASNVSNTKEFHILIGQNITIPQHLEIEVWDAMDSTERSPIQHCYIWFSIKIKK
jgi:hypothetical protein